MRNFISYLVTIFITVLTLGDVVSAVVVERSQGETMPSVYIVMLNEKANKTAHMGWMDNQRGKMSKTSPGSTLQVTYDYDALNGYAVNLTEDALAELSKSPDVAMVVQDSSCEGTLTQTNAPWGISRISRKTKLPAGSSVNSVNYIFKRNPSNPGVDVYVLDTGINTAHLDFGVRAKWGATFGRYKSADGHGHGTHVAGTIAGRRFGVAKAATVIAVKVLDDNNEGWNSDLIAGVNWAVARALVTGRPSVLSISIGSGPHNGVDLAVTRAVSRGLHVVVAAGNQNRDARNYSPARVPAVITVGATNINDRRWVWTADKGSNFGPGVDIFAPGEEITSAGIGSTTAFNRRTGTSMATPHVSGLIAYLLATEGPRTPAHMLARIKMLAPNGVLSGIPAGTGNEIIWNGGACDS